MGALTYVMKQVKAFSFLLLLYFVQEILHLVFYSIYNVPVFLLKAE